MIRTEIEHPSDLPWKERPPFGDLRLVPLLAAQAEIAAVSGDVATASTAAAALAEVRDRYPSEVLVAEAALAEARADLLAGDAESAVSPARLAVATWVDMDATYDAATARTVLGDALAASGSAEAARMEWEAALAAYDGYGAPLKAGGVRSRLSDGVTRRRSSDARSATITELVDCGDHWLLRRAGTEVVLPGLRGIKHLARLLAEPGREVAATELAGAVVAEPPLPVLDEEAREAYRRRLAEVEDDLAAAARDNDEARQQLAERDRDYLLAELRSAVGLGGRVRGTGGSAERARTSVTRSLRYALARLEDVEPELGRHLTGTVRTGTWCSYVPDPLVPIEWKVS
jgi:tetratricopeptide (TPR) repeat protein